jgi:hypothetical protein
MKGVAARSRADRHTALLWRRGRIRRRSTNDYSRIAHRTFAQHRLDIEGIGDVNVMAVHAHHANGEVRYSETKHIARLAAGPGRAVLAGDFSSVHGRPRGQRWAHLAEPDLEPDIDLLPTTCSPRRPCSTRPATPSSTTRGVPYSTGVPATSSRSAASSTSLPNWSPHRSGSRRARSCTPTRRGALTASTPTGCPPVAFETVEDAKALLSDRYLIIATVTAP